MKAAIVGAVVLGLLTGGCHRRSGAKKTPAEEEEEPAAAASAAPVPAPAPAAVASADAGVARAPTPPSPFKTSAGREASTLHVVRKNDLVFLGSSSARFDLATDTWSEVPPLPKKFRVNDAVALPDDRILVVGQNDVESFCLLGDAKKPWKKAPGLEGENAGLGTFADGRVVAAGGYDSNESRGLTVTRIFDPRGGGWGRGPALPEPAWFGNVFRRPDGSLVMEAHQPTPQVPRAFVLDPRAGSWTLAAKATEEQIAPSSLVLSDGTLVLVGGAPGARGALVVPPTRILTPKGTGWEELPPAPIEPLEATVAGEIEKGIVALVTRPANGQELLGYRPKISLFDVATRTWSSGPTFPRSLAPMQVLTRGDDVLVLASRGEPTNELVVARAPKSALLPTP